MKRALALAVVLAGCSQSGTGVALTIEGPGLAPDELDVVAAYDDRTVDRMVPLAGASLPVSLVAELPDETTSVTFTVTALAAGQPIASGKTPQVAVVPHRIADATVTLGAPGDGGAPLDGGDGGDAAPANDWSVRHAPVAGAGAITAIFGAGTIYATAELAGGVNLLRSTDGTNWTPSQAGSASLEAVWAADASNVFLAGDSDTILFGANASFVSQSSPAAPATRLDALWGVSSMDAYAVGASNTILHLVPGGWVSQNVVGATELFGVWGAGSDRWAVGTGGTILHTTTAAWSAQTSNATGTLYAVWGTGANDVYAVGAGGAIVHFTSGAWTEMTSNTSADLRAVWGAGGEVFAVGAGGVIVHFAGGAWTEMASGTTADLRAVWGTSASDVYAGGAGQLILHHP